MTGLKVRFAFLFLLIMTLGTAEAQKLRSFRSDVVGFQDDVQKFLTDIDKKQGVADANYFGNYWLNGNFSPSQQTLIVNISNELLNKRVRPYPDFRNFLYTCVAIYESGSYELLDSWLKDFYTYTQGAKIRDIGIYLESAVGIFKDRTINQSNILKWQAREGNFTYAMQPEPVFEFEGIDLVCYSHKDSSVVYNTSGKFYPVTMLFEASAGTIYWTRAGFTEDSLYTMLDRFTVDVRKAEFRADSAVLVSKYYLQEDVLGYFEEKILASASEDKARYPRFYSYNKQFVLKDIVPNINYVGGFGIEGTKFLGYGNEEEPAYLTFMYEDKLQIAAISKRFVFTKTEILGGSVATSVYMDGDSLFHPRLQLKYVIDKETLTLYRTKEGMSAAPFDNSYHKLEMHFDLLTWKMTEPKMIISNLQGGEVSPVLVESKSFFRDERYQKLQGMDDRNPLYALYKFQSRYDDKRDFYLEEICNFLMMGDHQCRVLMMNMTILGFVDYDIEKGKVLLEQKLFDYVNAHGGFIDYDIIQFYSISPGKHNAEISLENYDMRMFGIQPILLSDSQKVVLYPERQEIVLKRNRDFVFNGGIRAGRFDFYGRNYYFDYDEFRINMSTIDSMMFYVPSFEVMENGLRELVMVKNVLENFSGELFIDHPNNKSSRAFKPEYPIFKAGSDSYVYWDNPKIWNGVYRRDKVYFNVEIFEIDSLDDFKTEALSFNGRFFSGGIFPDFEENLKVQPDYSLGFVTQTPPEGYPLYMGKGKYTATISVSHQGIKGIGTIDYLSSKSVCSDITFFLDSTNAAVSDFGLAGVSGGVQFPSVYSTQNTMHWRVNEDKMRLTNSPTDPFHIFANNTELRGNITVTPKGLLGSGKTDFLNATAIATLYSFDFNRFYTDKAEFRLRPMSEGRDAFVLLDTKMDIDYNRNQGEFHLNNPADFIELPINQYAVFLDHALWDIPKKTISLDRTSEKSLSQMLSLNPRQDSLIFDAGYAKYHLADTLLEGFEVSKIYVADAVLYPDSEYVAIRAEARMDRLENARVIANVTSRNYEMYEASLQIYSRKKYDGSAYYDYIDKDQNAQKVYFNPVSVDTALNTVAKAIIVPADSFYLSPFFSFDGKISLSAWEPFLYFDGNTNIQHACESVKTEPIPFASFIDPKNIVIDLARFENESKSRKLYSGLFFTPTPTDLHSSFLSRLSSANDVEVFSAGGVLVYDESMNSFIISSREKIDDPKRDENIIWFNNRDCKIQGEGILAIDEGLNGVKVMNYSYYDHDLNRDTVMIDQVISFDFYFNSAALKYVGDKILEDNMLKGVNLTNDKVRKVFSRQLGAKKAKEVLDDLYNYGSLSKVPKELKATFFISDVSMSWDESTGSFVSNGPIGITFMGDQLINRSVNGKIELVKKRNGDDLTIYIELDKKNYFFFQYSRNVMQAFSGQEDFNNLIKDEELKKRQIELPNGQYYQYTISTRRRVQQFTERFEDLQY